MVVLVLIRGNKLIDSGPFQSQEQAVEWIEAKAKRELGEDLQRDLVKIDQQTWLIRTDPCSFIKLFDVDADLCKCTYRLKGLEQGQSHLNFERSFEQFEGYKFSAFLVVPQEQEKVYFKYSFKVDSFMDHDIVRQRYGIDQMKSVPFIYVNYKSNTHLILTNVTNQQIFQMSQIQKRQIQYIDCNFAQNRWYWKNYDLMQTVGPRLTQMASDYMNKTQPFDLCGVLE